MKTLIFGLFGICMFGATVFLFVLLIRALLKYLRSGEVRKEKTETKKTLGEALKAHRTRCNMTQEFVAESLGRRGGGLRALPAHHPDPARAHRVHPGRGAAAGGGGDTAHIEKESL